jgi:flavodoxin
MPSLLIVYGTSEGQTRKIARRMAERATERGHRVEIHDAATLPAGLNPAAFGAAVIAGSIHTGRYQAAITQFVRRHLQALQSMPSAFVSVSLSAAGDAEDREDAQACAERFLPRPAGARPRPTSPRAPSASPGTAFSSAGSCGASRGRKASRPIRAATTSSPTGPISSALPIASSISS